MALLRCLFYYPLVGGFDGATGCAVDNTEGRVMYVVIEDNL